MRQKRLTIPEKEQLQKMVIQGVAPEDISKFFGIAISSVHNYKKLMKKEGYDFPLLRGKRPVGIDQLSSFHVPMTDSKPVVQHHHEDFTTITLKGVTIRICNAFSNFNIEEDVVTIRP